MTVVPAYGRDYKSKAAVLADWMADKDFSMAGLEQGYINRQDADVAKLASINVRNGNQRKVAVLYRRTDNTWEIR